MSKCNTNVIQQQSANTFFVSNAILALGRVPTIRIHRFASMIFRRFKGFLTTRARSTLGKKHAEDAEISAANVCVR